VPSIEIVAPPPSSPPPPPPVLSAAEKASRARAKIAQEMLDTEQSYNNSLQVVIDHYIKPLQQAIVEYVRHCLVNGDAGHRRSQALSRLLGRIEWNGTHTADCAWIVDGGT